MTQDTKLIRVNKDTKELLERLKIHERESLNSVIKTLISKCYQLPKEQPKEEQEPEQTKPEPLPHYEDIKTTGKKSMYQSG